MPRYKRMTRADVDAAENHYASQHDEPHHPSTSCYTCRTTGRRLAEEVRRQHALLSQVLEIVTQVDGSAESRLDQIEEVLR